MFLDCTLVLLLKVIPQFTDFHRSGTILLYHHPPWLLWKRALEDITCFWILSHFSNLISSRAFYISNDGALLVQIGHVFSNMVLSETL